MNIIVFLAGAGVGALVSSILFIVVLIWAVGRARKEHVDVMADLMRERNAISERVEKHLAVIAEGVREASVPFAASTGGGDNQPS